MEELITTLQEENELYKKMIPIAEEKTKAIVANNLEELQKVTDKEQIMIDKMGTLEKKRVDVVNNIAVVLSLNPRTITLDQIVDVLHKQPNEQKMLREIHDKLRMTTSRLKDVNSQNKALVEESLQMLEFNMNVLRSTRMSSGSSNYTQRASQIDAGSGSSSMFDAKQ